MTAILPKPMPSFEQSTPQRSLLAARQHIAAGKAQISRSVATIGYATQTGNSHLITAAYATLDEADHQMRAGIKAEASVLRALYPATAPSRVQNMQRAGYAMAGMCLQAVGIGTKLLGAMSWFSQVVALKTFSLQRPWPKAPLQNAGNTLRDLGKNYTARSKLSVAGGQILKRDYEMQRTYDAALRPFAGV